MQQVVIDKPYQFVPPYRGAVWVKLLQLLMPRYLWRTWGVRSHEIRGVAHLQASLDAGHGSELDIEGLIRRKNQRHGGA